MVRRDRYEVNPFRELLAGLYRRDVGIDKDRLDSLLLQGFEALTAGVVELAAGTTSFRLLLRPLLPRSL
jgi:hypothetical protein